MTDKTPLHVRVAEALGWFGFEPSLNGMWPDEWRGFPPTPIVGEPTREVPRYDTDWSATGPLFRKHGRALMRSKPGAVYVDPEGNWYAWVDPREWVVGPTPEIAICNLILALHTAGKLRETHSSVGA